MEIVANQKQISANDKAQIEKQVKDELIEHLYQGCLPGTVSGMVASVVLYFDYHGYIPQNLLVIWFIVFNLMMFSLTALYFTFKKFKSRLNLVKWEWTYSILMTGC